MSPPPPDPLMIENSPPSKQTAAEFIAIERAERVRLADVLHDGALQRVLAMRLELFAMQDGAPDSLPFLIEEAHELERELRALTSSMQEDSLDRLPLSRGIEQISDAIASVGRHRTVLQIDPACEGIHDSIVRNVVRELLRNVARHARASTVNVTLACRENQLTIIVGDDGLGFDRLAALAAERLGHIGLQRIRRLTSNLGGTFTIDGTPGQGTTATMRVPIPALRAQLLVEEQQQDARRFSTALLSCMQDGLLVFQDATLVQVNGAFCHMTGFAAETLVGLTEPDYPFWPADDVQRRRELVQVTGIAGGVQQVVRVRRADGSEFPASLTTARIDPVGPRRHARTTLATIKSL